MLDHFFVISLLCVAAIRLADLAFTKFRLLRLSYLDMRWYLSNAPDLLRGDQVACNQCGSFDIRAHQLSPYSSLRAHVCQSCEVTLFYSSQQLGHN